MRDAAGYNLRDHSRKGLEELKAQPIEKKL
jgi:hypothetical protein